MMGLGAGRALGSIGFVQQGSTPAADVERFESADIVRYLHDTYAV